MPIEETENEIRARIQSPDKYDPKSFRRAAFPPNKPEKGVFAIYGCPKGEWKAGRCQVGVQIQSLRFSKEAGWTLAKVRAWLKAHNLEVTAEYQPAIPLERFELIPHSNELKIKYLASIFADAEKDHYARIYLIDTSVCGNNWRVTDEALEQAAKSLIGKPLTIGHGGPEIGKFVDYQKTDGQLYGLANITDELAWERIKIGSWQKVSVNFNAGKVICSVCGADVTFAPDEHIRNRTGHEVIEKFVFEDVGIVLFPAYPRAKVEEIDGVKDVWPTEPGTATIVMPISNLTCDTVDGITYSSFWPPENPGTDFSRRLTAELEKNKIAQALAPEEEPWGLTAAEINELPDAAFAWIHPDYPEKSSDKRLRKLPHHKKVGGTLKVVWRGVAAAMAVLLGARGGVDLPRDEKRNVYNHLAAHYRQFDKEAPDFKAEQKGGKKVTEQENRIEELEQQVAKLTKERDELKAGKEITELAKERDDLKAKLDEIGKVTHEAKVAALLDQRIAVGITREADREAEGKQLGELPDVALDQLAEDAKKIAPPESSEPKPKAKAGEGLSPVEETRKRLFGYHRDAMASDGGKIVG